MPQVAKLLLLDSSAMEDPWVPQAESEGVASIYENQHDICGQIGNEERQNGTYLPAEIHGTEKS